MITLTPKYKVVLKDEGGHHYAVEGSDNWLPGVTTPLEGIPKPFLRAWAAKLTAEYLRSWVIGEKEPVKLKKDADEIIRAAKAESKRASQEAKDLGSKLHKFADTFINRNGEYNPDGLGILADAFKQWVFDTNPVFICGDTKVISIVHGYGGAIDAAIEIDGKVEIVDFKTSKQLSADHIIQGSAYCVAFRETYGLDYLPTFRCVRFEKDPKVLKKTSKMYEEGFPIDVERSFDAFICALKLYKHLQKGHYRTGGTA